LLPLFSPRGHAGSTTPALSWGALIGATIALGLVRSLAGPSASPWPTPSVDGGRVWMRRTALRGEGSTWSFGSEPAFSAHLSGRNEIAQGGRFPAGGECSGQHDRRTASGGFFASPPEAHDGQVSVAKDTQCIRRAVRDATIMPAPRHRDRVAGASEQRHVGAHSNRQRRRPRHAAAQKVRGKSVWRISRKRGPTVLGVDA
jgi:hypothetical protein